MMSVPKLLTEPLTTCVERPKKNRNQVLGSRRASISWYFLKVLFLMPVWLPRRRSTASFFSSSESQRLRDVSREKEMGRGGVTQ